VAPLAARVGRAHANPPGVGQRHGLSPRAGAGAAAHARRWGMDGWMDGWMDGTLHTAFGFARDGETVGGRCGGAWCVCFFSFRNQNPGSAMQPPTHHPPNPTFPPLTTKQTKPKQTKQTKQPNQNKKAAPPTGSKSTGPTICPPPPTAPSGPSATGSRVSAAPAGSSRGCRRPFPL
jgi:hypothetical protein